VAIHTETASELHFDGAGEVRASSHTPTRREEADMTIRNIEGTGKATRLTTYTAHGMTCEHCRIAVSTAIAQIDGVESVHVDLVTGRVRVVGADVSDTTIAAAVADEGYGVTS
jgi:copper chaperone CopZ